MKLISYLFLSGVLKLVVCSDPKVTLEQGSIVGIHEHIQDKDINVFLGIPYAKPPLDELRFRKPQPLTQKWQNPLEAKKWSNVCIQHEIKIPPTANIVPFGEDCLYLNVWTPVNLESDFTNNLKSVMVYFHGGSFVVGSASHPMHNSSVLSAIGDVIVVTVNYRLGALGFLYGGNDAMPGNMGLYDQALALEWVQKNIAYFGGDKDSVTIFGISAGSMSVVYHLLSPVSQSLFKNAIAMSGVAMENVLTDSSKTAIKTRNYLAKVLNCEVNEDDETVSEVTLKCLREVDPQKFHSVELANISEIKVDAFNAWFYPVFGEAFLPKPPKIMWQEKMFKHNSSLLIGAVPKEGEVFQMLSLLKTSKKGIDDMKELKKHLDSFSSATGLPVDSDEIEKFYYSMQGHKDEKSTVYKALGDFYFKCPISMFSEYFSEVNYVYQYLLDFEPDLNFMPQVCKGMCHGSDIPFVFGMTMTPGDINKSVQWIKILTKFAKTGKTHWPKYQRTKYGDLLPFYYKMGQKEADNSVEIGYEHFACNLWKRMLI